MDFRLILKTIFLIITICICLTFSPGPCAALDGADVALYNDSIAPSGYSGAWQDGITAIKNMLSDMGLSYEEITYNDLNDSIQDFRGLYKVLLFPGGFAQWYNYWISKSGKKRIRDFISSGGGYFGICAGAYFACDRVVWKGETYDDHAGYNAYGELTGYDLDLFPGTGTGPIDEIARWDYEGYDMTTFDFKTDNNVLQNYKAVPYTEDILYYGGPWFSTDHGEDVKALATYRYNGEAGIVAFEYGSGRVVLSAPHPEIEEDSSRDGVTIDREDVMDDKGSDWELARHILAWLKPGGHPSCPELYSWNGEDYQFTGAVFTSVHSPQSEHFQIQIIAPPVAPIGNTLSFMIKEVDGEESYINSVDMYYRYAWAPSDQWTRLNLLMATHNETGVITGPVRERDEIRALMMPGDKIFLSYALPPLGILGAHFSCVSTGYYLYRDETWCEVLGLGQSLEVKPGDTVTLRALINNMSTEALPENASAWFLIENGAGTRLGPVSAAGLPPAEPRWYEIDWLVPADISPGIYSYKAAILVGENDITWHRHSLEDLPDEPKVKRDGGDGCGESQF